MKKTLLAFILLFSLFACSSPKDNNENVPNSDQKEVDELSEVEDTSVSQEEESQEENSSDEKNTSEEQKPGGVTSGGEYVDDSGNTWYPLPNS